MGADAVIFFQLKKHAILPYIPFGDVDEIDDGPGKATHQVSGLGRYYDGEQYTSGSWPDIAATLIRLLGDEGVKRVWYGSDYMYGENGYRDLPEMTLQKLIDVTKTYVEYKHGSE